MRIGLLSDTHGHLDQSVWDYLDECQELWHAGDIGSLEVVRALQARKPLRAVVGNIDGPELRGLFPEDLHFVCEGVRVWISHITGYPGHWDRKFRPRLQADPPDLLIGGHSHILRIARDRKLGLLFLNPGACGNHGFHEQKTMLRFTLEEGKPKDMQIVQLGPRGATVGRKDPPRQE